MKRYVIGGAVGALALVAVGLFTLPHVAAATQEPQAEQTPDPDGTPPAGGSHVGDDGDYEAALAAALGLSVDDLQLAYASARSAALDQAVDEGILTEEEAEELASHGSSGRYTATFGLHGSDIDTEALFADALGITVDELNAAQEEAYTTLLDQAVEAGDLTQEEADAVLARRAVSPYLAEALASAYENAIQQALADGAITQEQASQLRETPYPGLNMSGGFRGGRGHHEMSAPDDVRALPSLDPSYGAS